MKSIFFVLITIAALSSCKGECNYNEPIEGVLVTNWERSLYPNHGKIYSYKAGTNFTDFVDSFDLTIIKKNLTRTDWTTCYLTKEKPTYRNDIRLVLDDTLVYDISDITLSWYVDQRHWTMGGPMEYCIVSSLKVNGRIVRDTIGVGYLKFPCEYARVLKR